MLARSRVHASFAFVQLTHLEGRLQRGLTDSKAAETQIKIKNAKEEARALEAKIGSLNAQQRLAANKVRKQMWDCVYLCIVELAYVRMTLALL